jgi:peptidoglycan DL-endopeptidase CwlO
VATGGDKAYGDQLASWLIANASRLAVEYIIWYDRIWHVTNPGVWKAYSRGNGDPASDHTNHLHVSIY